MKTPNDKKTVLHLLTEIAMVEHLLRNRHDKVTPAGMTTGQFGVLTHFIRNEKSRERLSLLAWAFQDDDAYMAQKVTSLVERDLLTTVAVEGSSNGDLWVEHLLTSLPGGTVGFLIVVNILFFGLAFFLDFFELAFIAVPLIGPVAEKLGIDLTQFNLVD